MPGAALPALGLNQAPRMRCFGRNNIWHFSCLRLLRRGPDDRFMFVVHFRHDLVLVTLQRRPFGSAPEP